MNRVAGVIVVPLLAGASAGRAQQPQAEAMPTPEQMSFGDIIAHESASKDELAARIRRSFDSCRAVVAGLSESAELIA